MAAVWLPDGCRGIAQPSEMEWRVDKCALAHLVYSVMMEKDGKESVDAMLMECCRCQACAIQPTLSFVSNPHCLHTLFVETRERALSGTRSRFVELARGDEQQMK